MVYSVKSAKGRSAGREGYGFSATICADGRAIGTAIDYGDGGSMEIVVKDAADKATLEAYVKGLPRYEYFGHFFDVTVDVYVSELVCAALNAARLKRLCAKSTLFRVKGDQKDECRTVKAPYSEKVKEFLKKKYGDSLEEIVNERFAKGA